MRSLSTAELVALGERFHVEIDDAEADLIREGVNEMLSTVDALEDVPVSRPEDEVGARPWGPPANDSHGAIAADCRVPPSGEGSLSEMTAGIKDIIAVAGIPMECGSPVMRGYVPAADATVVSRLRAAGATITAKTALDEFAASPSGTTGVGGPIRNPADPERTAGGSSGGSAAAVKTGRVDVALGTDTGGSIRIPASYCGIVGLKPTYGLVSLAGVVENTYTQDHVGPMTTTVDDAAAVLEAIAGVDEADPASLAAAGREEYRVGGYADAVADPPDLADARFGVLEDGLGDGVSTPVAERTAAAIDRLEAEGAAIHRVSVDHFDAAMAIKNALSFVELAVHWRAGGAPYRRGGGVDDRYQVALARRRSASGELGTYYKQKLLAGARIVEAHAGNPYTRAQAAREVLRKEFEGALADVDALCLPTMPDVAPRIDNAGSPGFDPGRHTRAADVTRLPAISLPGLFVDGLPIGFQLMAGPFQESHLLGLAAAVENHLE